MTAERDITRVGVIMAGGSGERFWPLSRRLRPKQLLRLTHSEKTMLEEAVERIAPLIPAEHVYVATGEHLVEPIREAKVGVPDENIIAEPCKRNTSGCLAYAAAHALAKYGDPDELTDAEAVDKRAAGISMAVTTADHMIGEPERFRATVAAALDVVERNGALGTLGVVPTRPETGYGYIEATPELSPLPESPEGHPVYPAATFHEKPDAPTAETFVATGRHFWNSGMFFWKLSAFLRELDHAQPDLAAATRDMALAMARGDDEAVRATFEALDNISIDYALMERAEKVVVARADFPWDDVGAWPALERSRACDDDGNVTEGDVVLADCRGCIVYNEPGAQEMAVGVVGAEDLVVVVSKDAVLVLPKERAQDVKTVVAELKKRDAGQL